MDKYCDNNDNNNLIMDKNIEDNSDDIKNDVNLDCCWKNKQLNYKQNNITTTTATTTTTTTTTVTTNKIYHKNGEKTNDTEMDEQRNKDEEKQPIKSDNDDDDDEDSTDNLSYLNENDIIDDIILLPSDDELSNNADDCIIYAYRGSANDLQQNLQQNRRINQQQQQQPDDETDFLEMDFDPEPTSETDIYCGGGGVNDDDDDIINNGFNIKKKLLVMNGSNLNSVSNGSGVGGGGIGEFDCNYYRSSNNDDAGYDNNFISTIDTQSKILGTEIIQNLLPSTTEFIPIIKSINKVPLLEEKNSNFSNQNKELPINIVNLLPKEKENLIITTTTKTSPLLSSTAATTTTKTTATTTKISTSTADLLTTTTAATITTTTTPIILLETNNKINKITGTKPKKPQQQDINKINNSRMQQQQHQQQQQQQSQMYNNFSNHNHHHHHQYNNHNQNLNNQTTINCHNIDSSHELFNNKNKLTTKIAQHNQQQSPYSTQTQTTTLNNHHICLDCTENEFLFNTTNNRGENRTINDNCRNLCSKNKENTFNQFQQQQHQQHQYKNMKINQTRADKIQNLGLNLNELNTFDSGIKKLTKLQFLLPNFNTQNVRNDLCYGFDNDKISTEKTINIYSLNCDEKILTDSLRMIDIVPADINIIKQYFNDINRDTIDMSIPEYILHLSKSNCDYNKLITLIRTSCINYNLEFYFCPEDPFSSTPETINIQTSELIKRWNSNTNLKEIMKIKNKHFHTMNILGKIINILRQPTKQLSAENYIKIPQYYKSGFIRITKKENFK